MMKIILLAIEWIIRIFLLITIGSMAAFFILVIALILWDKEIFNIIDVIFDKLLKK